MLFSTDPDPVKSKTKCMLFSKKDITAEKVKLDNNELPWVTSAKHLGSLLSSKVNLNPVSSDTTKDLNQKKAIFFQKVHELCQCYHYCDPRIVCHLVRIFATSFYGSSLWNLSSPAFQQLARSWNTTVKIVWYLPWETHKRFVENLTEVPHMETTLHSRYIAFLKCQEFKEVSTENTLGILQK